MAIFTINNDLTTISNLQECAEGQFYYKTSWSFL